MRGAQAWVPCTARPCLGNPGCPSPLGAEHSPKPSPFPSVFCVPPPRWGRAAPGADAARRVLRLRAPRHLWVPGGCPGVRSTVLTGLIVGLSSLLGGPSPRHGSVRRAQPRLRSIGGRVCPLAPAAALRSAAPGPPWGGGSLGRAPATTVPPKAMKGVGIFNEILWF